MATNPFDRPEYEKAPAFSLTKSPIGSNFVTANSTPATTTRTTLEKLYTANKAQGVKNAQQISKLGVDPRIIDLAMGGLAMEVQGPEVALTAAQKLIRAIRGAPNVKGAVGVKGVKSIRADLEAAYTAERAARAFKGRAAAEALKGEAGAIASRSVLKGELAQRPTFAPIRPLLEQSDVDNLFESIRTSRLDFFDQQSAYSGLWSLFKGEVPPTSQLSHLEDIFGSDLVKAVQSQRTGWEKFKSLTTDVLNIPRAFMTSLDMSAPLRQGVLFTTTKPKQAIPAFGEMLKDFFSQKNFDRWLADIPNNPRYRQMKDSGLYIANPNKLAEGLSAREESFMSNIAEKVPIAGRLVKASSRAYIGYLNKLRVDVFTNIAAKFEKEGVATPDVLESLADFVNAGTGRGDLGKYNRVAAQLNNWFFSPRLMASRVSFLNPAWYFKQPWPVRKEAIKTFAEFVGVNATILGLAKLNGQEVEPNLKSADAYKIKESNTRWDTWGGFIQWARVLTQIASGERKSTNTGKITKLEGGTRNLINTRFGTGLAFGLGKLAPIPGLAAEILIGQKLFGNDPTLKNELIENMVPLYLQDMKAAVEDLGPEAIFTVGVPGFFGVGTQTYTQPKTSGNPFNR